MLGPKRRLQVYVNADLADRGVAATKRLPGVSLSGVVDEYLERMVPILEEIAEAFETGDPVQVRRSIAHTFGEAMLRIVDDVEETAN